MAEPRPAPAPVTPAPVTPAPDAPAPPAPAPVLVRGGPRVQLPTRFGAFTAQAWEEEGTGVEHLSVSAPGTDPAPGDPLVRLHSECLTGDVFGSYRCDCGEQLDHALELVALRGGTIIYLRGQEGRGIGLANKMRAYQLQETGVDTLDANAALGLPVDGRDYAAGAAILHALGLTRIRLLSNNPLKSAQLTGYGIHVTALVPSTIAARAENRFYLETKRDRLHHTLQLAPSHGKDTPA